MRSPQRSTETGAEVSRVRCGDTVICEDVTVCGGCEACKTGQMRLCRNGLTLDGRARHVRGNGRS